VPRRRIADPGTLKTDRRPDILRKMEETFSVFGFDIPVRLINLTGGGPETFEAISRRHTDILKRHVGLDPSHAVLEIGCGIGRDAIPLLQILGPVGRYWGVDIIKDSIDWCQANIGARNPEFQFLHYDVKDQLHNPGGSMRTTSIRLPIADASVDRIFLWSVFTHMFQRDIVHYLREFRRVLKTNGRVYATWFVVNDAVLESARKTNLTPFDLRFEHVASPGCYINNPARPASAVAYEERNVHEMMKESGLELVGEFLRGNWSGFWPDPHAGQDATILALPSRVHRPADFRMRNLAKRCIYRARQSSTLRRIAALPVLSSLTNAVCHRVLQPPGDYPTWIADRLLARRKQYPARGEQGLLSFITTVWNTPVPFLGAACQSLLRAQSVSNFEWVLLDNGSTDAATCRYLRDHVAIDPRVKFLRVEKNLGLVGGMRHALNHATGRYVLPFDSDDVLYPDAVAILTNFIHARDYPPVLYSDEDKLDENGLCWPYFKPDWDPVLFLNSCFIAHLGCFDRKLALELGVYGEQTCEGCHDWDTFLRFMLAGHNPAHLPEMLYSWRMHPNSTSGNINSKGFIHGSHRAVLSRFLSTRPRSDRYELKSSPLFNGTPDWWFFRKPVEPAPLLSVLLSLDPDKADSASHLASCEYPGHQVQIVHARKSPRELLPLLENRRGLVCITFDSVKLTHPHWPWEVLGLTELHPDTVMIGGWLIDRQERTADAPRVLGFGGLFGCPDRGRHISDPGYSAWMWKQRSVSGVSTHLCVIDVQFLRQVIEEFRDAPMSWFFLGAWAAASARRSGKRIVYTPFLRGQSDFDVDSGVSHQEMVAFAGACADVMPDTRFYSRHFGLLPEQAYQPIPEFQREASERQLFAHRS
jgi:glycosyltransferase involved in cell wall biosynthesis/SAM-dependent methyltransferase